MPTKKSVKRTTQGFDFQKLVQNSDSYKSLIYGIVTVVVLFIVIALGVRTLSQNRAQVDDQAAMTEEANDVLTSNYTVSEGETLWSIAEKSYGDGYAWVDIAEANKLTSPDAIEKGQKLTIPKRSTKLAQGGTTPTTVPTTVVSPTRVTTPVPTKAMEVMPVNEKISGNNYTVVEGDNLWNIAVRAYGDGYKWVEIAKNNKVADPDLIYPGDKFTLQR